MWHAFLTGILWIGGIAVFGGLRWLSMIGGFRDMEEKLVIKT